MNVLLYNDEGTSAESVRQTFNCLQQHLSPHYVVSTVTARQLIEEPWAPYTSLLVIPGGADKPYCSKLNGAGNKAIEQYVKKGGRFLGICAGGYYGAAQISFEEGTDMEVSGPRELGFYSGIARGTVFKGFDYDSDKGAKAAQIRVPSGELSPPLTFRSYFNGGCLFEGDSQAETVAEYVCPVDIENAGPTPAAVVFKKHGKGSVILSGIHFEYELSKEDARKRDVDNSLVELLHSTRETRAAFIDFLFKDKLGLKVTFQSGGIRLNETPKLTPLYLSSLSKRVEPHVSELMSDLFYSLDPDTSSLQDKTDTFRFLKAGVPEEYAGYGKEIIAARLAAGAGVKPSKPGIVSGSAETQSVANKEEKSKDGEDSSRIHTVFVYDVDEMYPRADETPQFDHSLYYQELQNSIKKYDVNSTSHLGATLMYASVLTSTSSILERNPQFLQVAPDGLVTFGTQQTAGRGRGTNTWVNPVGVMALSGVLRIKKSQCNEPLVFIQYLCSLGLLRAVESLLPNSEDIGLRLKWPNDVYMKLKDERVVKIGGNMVSCNVIGDEFVIVVGSGTNLDNSEPTTCINAQIRELGMGEPIRVERLLARFLTIFHKMVQQFLVSGFSIFAKDYYKAWLHSNAKVTLERHANVSATIVGISLETGMLLAKDENGVQYELQPDGNSFDVMRGLIRRKA